MNGISFNYTFPVFYTIALKGRTRFSQVDLLSHLLRLQKQEKSERIDDSICSNYVKGKTKISSNYRVAFYLENIEKIEPVIKYLGIKEIKESILCIQTLLLNGKLQLHDTAKRESLLTCLSSDESPEYKIAFALIASIDNSEQLELLDNMKQKTLLKYREEVNANNSVNNAKNEYSVWSSPISYSSIQTNIQESDWLLNEESVAYQEYEIVTFLFGPNQVGDYDQFHAFAVDNNIHPLCDYTEKQFIEELVCHARFPNYIKLRLSERAPSKIIKDIPRKDLFEYLQNLSRAYCQS